MDGRAQNIPAVLRLLLGFVVLSTVTGLLMAGIAIPAIGASGQAAKGGVDFFNELPSDFTVSPLAQQSRILDADGKLIANPYDENRIIVPLKKISKTMRNAQIAIEDARFYEHGGLDLRGFTRAMVSNVQGGDVQGASTLTQQYVKITLQENALRRGDEEAAKAAVQKSYARKVQELKYAINVEENYTKDQILEGYLNLVYYGDQAYGVEAAALNYFGVHANKLNLAQSALLAGVVQQPTAYNPVLNPEQAQIRRDLVLNRMQALGMASAEDVAKAKKTDVAKMIKKKPVKGVCHRSSQPYYCAYVMAYLQKAPEMAALGKTPEERLKRINQGGLTIRTSLDSSMQKAAQQEIEKAVPVGNKSNLGGAVTIVEPGTGKILAMAQAADFDKDQTNVNVPKVYGGGPYGYQFGSTAKVFGLVTALEQGMPLNATMQVPFADAKTPHTFDGPDVLGVKCGASDPWEVKNDYAIGGRQMTLAEGISKSINTWAAQLSIDVGPCNVQKTMTKMGLRQGDGEPIEATISNVTLGSGTTTPLSIASAFATIAASGKYCEPNPIVSITTPDKKEIKVPAAEVQAGHLQGRRRRRGVPPQGDPALGRHRQRSLERRPASGGREDRHDREAQPGLVRRVHPAGLDGGVDRQRQGRRQERHVLLAQRQVLRRLRLLPGRLRRHGLRTRVGGGHEARHRRPPRQGLPRSERQGEAGQPREPAQRVRPQPRLRGGHPQGGGLHQLRGGLHPEQRAPGDRRRDHPVQAGARRVRHRAAHLLRPVGVQLGHEDHVAAEADEDEEDPATQEGLAPTVSHPRVPL